MKKSLLSVVLTIFVLSASLFTACDFGNTNVGLGDVNAKIALCSSSKTAEYTVNLYVGSTLYQGKTSNFTRNADLTVTVTTETKSLNPEPLGEVYLNQTATETVAADKGKLPEIKQIKIDYFENEAYSISTVSGKTKVEFVPNAAAFKDMFDFTDAEIASVSNPKLVIELTDKPISYRLTYTVDGYNAVIDLKLGY